MAGSLLLGQTWWCCGPGRDRGLLAPAADLGGAPAVVQSLQGSPSVCRSQESPIPSPRRLLSFSFWAPPRGCPRCPCRSPEPQSVPSVSSCLCAGRASNHMAPPDAPVPPWQGAGVTAAGLDATGASFHLLGGLCSPRLGQGTEEAGLAIPLSSLQERGSDTHCQEGTRDGVPEERGFSEQPSQQLMHHLQAPESPSCHQLSRGLPALCSAVRVPPWGWGWCPGTCMLLAS